jgi:hypothetical protein
MSSKYLSVSTVATGDTEFHVYWETEQVSGRLDVTIELPIEDKAIAAELWALRHLLLTAEVTGINRTGDNLTINVSHGAIRKLLMKKSSKKHLIRFTSWMTVRFRDAKVTAPKRRLDIESIEQALSETGRLVINTESNPDDITVSPVIGQVKITQHAVSRYIERTGVSSASRAWRSILQLVKSDLLHDAELPADVELRKKRKHQENARIMNVMNNWQMVFTPADESSDEPWVLVTVYQRP